MKQNLFEEQMFSPFALCDFCQILSWRETFDRPTHTALII